MSYEGYTQWRCECGVIESADVYMAQPLACPGCGERWTRRRSVDQTNGREVLPWREIEYRARFKDYVGKGYGQ